MKPNIVADIMRQAWHRIRGLWHAVRQRDERVQRLLLNLLFTPLIATPVVYLFVRTFYFDVSSSKIAYWRYEDYLIFGVVLKIFVPLDAFCCLALLILSIAYFTGFWRLTLLKTIVFALLFIIILAILLPMLARAREKPVIYLYPEHACNVDVSLDYPGEIAFSYPGYGPDGWRVLARPDGMLVDMRTGREHHYLFWEGTDSLRFPIESGFVVRGEDTVAFLEDALDRLGLNAREANDFIVYWLPRMVANPYNLIHFATDEYADAVPLDISPKPDTVIRILMLFRGIREPVAIPAQELSHPLRQGFTVVEWGGTEW